MCDTIIQENVHTLTKTSTKCVLNLFIVFHGMEEMSNEFGIKNFPLRIIICKQ